MSKVKAIFGRKLECSPLENACPVMVLKKSVKFLLCVRFSVAIFEWLVNQEKMLRYFLESLLPQALWVAAKGFAPYD